MTHAGAVSDKETLANKLDPTSSADDYAFPLDRLVLDPADALGPSLGVDGPLVTVDPGPEETFGGFVTDDLSPLPLGVPEQVSSGQDGRLGVVNGLDEGAASDSVSAS